MKKTLLYLIGLATLLALSGLMSAYTIVPEVIDVSNAESRRKLDFDEDTYMYLAIPEAPSASDSYMLWDDWGGTWSDAEKLPDNDEDDLMCWAAAASNVLEWTGWGQVSGMYNTDQMFQHFQDHWTDEGGLPEYAWHWWFDGTETVPGPSWASVDQPGGGNFWPTYTFTDYYDDQWVDSQTLAAIDAFLHRGGGVTLGIYTDGGGAHAITCWGFSFDSLDPDYYVGVWVTDSDDDKHLSTPPDRLRYYDVAYDSGHSRWHLQNFYGSDNWYIGGVMALQLGLGATPWPMFRHDPAHSGYTTSTSPSSANLDWSFTTYGLSYIRSSPAVANGKVYFGCDDNKIYALDQSTGELIWDYTTSGDVKSSPAVADGKVFVGDYAGHLYALNEDTGVLNWSRSLGNIIYASPTIVHNKVFVTSFYTSGNHYGYIWALNKDNGSTIWAERIVIQGYSVDVYAYSSPSVAGNLVFFGARGYGGRTSFFARRVADGSPVWERGMPISHIYSSPSAVEGSRVYIGNDDGYLYALDFDTGFQHWRAETRDAIRSSPAIANGKVFVGSYDANVYAFSMLNGSKIWNYTTGGPVRSSPAVADGKVIVGSDDGFLYVLDQNSGSLIWQYSLGGVVESSPAVAGGRIFVGSNAGKVYAFEPEPGKLQSLVYFNLSPNPVSVGETFVLRGILIDEHYQPLPYRSVAVYARPLDGSWQFIESVITRPGGFFKWQATVPGTVALGTYIIAVYYSGSVKHQSTYSLAPLIIQ